MRSFGDIRYLLQGRITLFEYVSEDEIEALFEGEIDDIDDTYDDYDVCSIEPSSVPDKMLVFVERNLDYLYEEYEDILDEYDIEDDDECNILDEYDDFYDDDVIIVVDESGREYMPIIIDEEEEE